MTRIDSAPARLDEPGPAARRIDADNQRDSWLRQMELAQLAQMGAGATAPASRAPASAASASLGPAALAQPAAHALARPSAAAERSAAAGDGAAAATSRPAAHASGESSADAGSTVADAGAPRASLAIAATPGQPPALDGVPSSVSFAPAAPAGGNSALAPAAAPAVAPAVSLAAAARTSTPVATPAAPEPAATAAENGEPPQWQKRIMHLTGEGDDVQLWIRDGELSPAQSQQLVARLAADVAAMGLRLKEATVNGKSALRSPARITELSEAVADLPQPIIHPTTER